MNELMDLKERMEHERPAQWHELPDIALYMDQIIAYMPRQLIRFDDREALTSAMVNNYIKDGLVPRAAGKRYGPIHLGCGRGRRATNPRRSSISTSAAHWTGPSTTPPPPSTGRPAGRTWPAWRWTWPCAATPTSWPAPAFWIVSSLRRRSMPRRRKKKSREYRRPLPCLNTY